MLRWHLAQLTLRAMVRGQGMEQAAVARGGPQGVASLLNGPTHGEFQARLDAASSASSSTVGAATVQALEALKAMAQYCEETVQWNASAQSPPPRALLQHHHQSQPPEPCWVLAPNTLRYTHTHTGVLSTSHD